MTTNDTAAGAIAQIRDRVATARRRTRDGLAEATRAMSEVQTSASATLSQRLDDVAGQSGANLLGSLSAHEALVRGYVSSMVEVADEQVELAREASTHTAAIARAGQQMGRASKSSQLVAMNALISSARLGTSGGALAVLANEMQGLAVRVRNTASEVGTLARDLARLLPQIEENVGAVKDLTGRLLHEFEGSTSQVHDGVSGLRGALTQLHDGGAGAVEVAHHAERGAAALGWGPAVERHLDGLEEVADTLDQLAEPGRAAA